MSNSLVHVDRVGVKDRRLLEALVEKKVLTSSGQGKWEPRHAMCSDTDFVLSRPTADQSIGALREVLHARGACLQCTRHPHECSVMNSGTHTPPVHGLGGYERGICRGRHEW